MTDPTPTIEEESNETEDFGELFESYSARMMKTPEVGDLIETPIIAIGDESVFVDTGTKVDGYVEKQELLDEEGNLPYAEGDILELYVVAQGDQGMRLSRALKGAGSARALESAYQQGVPVEGKVSSTCKGGFQVDLMGQRAFCPVSQMDVRYVDKPAEYVNQTLSFLIIQFERRGRNIVVSRRELLERELKKVRAEFLEKLKIGDDLEGRITHLVPYGAFVELLPGLEGMIHISELRWTRVRKPEEVVQAGEVVTARVVDMSPDKKTGNLRIALSLKQTLEDPWERIEESAPTGEVVTGTVTTLTRFGAFVEIAPGIEGLVHISEMSHFKRIGRPQEMVQPDDEVQVLIKEVDSARRRISLSMKEVEGDPWALVTEKYRPGQTVAGTLENRQDFGAFVSLEPGVTGLVPASRMRGSSRAAELDKLKPGDSFPVIIEGIDANERRMTLAPADSQDEAGWREFSGEREETLGLLGSRLKSALENGGSEE